MRTHLNKDLSGGGSEPGGCSHAFQVEGSASAEVLNGSALSVLKEQQEG